MATEVNFIDSDRHNKTAYLTKAMIIRSYSKEMECSRIEENSRFSLTHKSDQLLRHKNRIKKNELDILSKPFKLSKKDKNFINMWHKCRLFTFVFIVYLHCYAQVLLCREVTT